MNTFTQKFDNALDTIQAMIMSLLTRLGPFAVAAMPALFSGYSIFVTFQQEAGLKLALLFAVVVGLALEVVGIVACHTALDMYDAKEAGKVQPIKFKLMVWLLPAYIISVAFVVIYAGDAFSPLVKGLGVVSPLLTTITYVAVALHREVRRVEAEQATAKAEQKATEAEQATKQAAIEAEQRQWEREKERLELEQKHAERMERIRVKGGVKPVKYNALNVINAEKQAEKLRNLETVLTYLAGNPQATLSQIGGEVGVSKTTAKTYADELIQAGRLVKNGHGWEVLS